MSQPHRIRDITLREKEGTFIVDTNQVIAISEFDTSEVYDGIAQPKYCPFCRDSRPGAINVHTTDAHNRCVIHYLSRSGGK